MKLAVDTYPHLDSARLFSLVAHQPWAVFLDSGFLAAAKQPLRSGNYDVLAIKPERTLVCVDGQTTIMQGGQTLDCDSDPIEALKLCLADFPVDQNIAYGPGALGYFSYDLARCFEELPVSAANEEQLPEMAIGIYQAVVVVDHRQKQCSLLYLQDSDQAQEVVLEWRQWIEDCLDESLAEPGSREETFWLDGQVADSGGRLLSAELEENLSREDYDRCFDRVRSYTIEGDCYQVNFAKQFSTRVNGDAWLSYQRLRNMSPAPYGAYFNFPFAQILSNSPESFIQCRQQEVVTSPIKGTAARDHNDAQRDSEIAENLQNSSKDRAENLMIVDLMRNDLSKCCELGSVKVPSLFALRSFANVHHLVSTITGRLRKGMHALDLLRSCFPGGSITGAPKIRAMEIIEELEPHRRGLYCGAIAYIGMDGGLETNIAIRTITVKDGLARFSAGGGLVIDSGVEEEYQELLDKASMMHAALKN